MASDFTVMLQGEVGAEWERAIGTRRLHVKSPIPSRVNLDPAGEHDVYFLDMEATSLDLIDRIVNYLATKGGERPDLVLREVLSVGLPIRAEHCGLCIANPQKLI